MLAHDDAQTGRRLRHQALVFSASVWKWTETVGLRVEDGNVLLALSETDGMGAPAVSNRSGLPLDVVYAALHRLTDRGYVIEEHRHHRLTAEGQRLMAEFDPNAQTKGMS
jgi:hypothetical protein